MRRTALAALVLVTGAWIAVGPIRADSGSEKPNAPADDENVLWEDFKVQILPQAPSPLRPIPEPRTPLEPRLQGAPLALCLARGAADDVCGRGRQISHMRPCVDPGDCPALEAWRGLYGEPRLVPATPPPTPAAAAAPAAAKEDD